MTRNLKRLTAISLIVASTIGVTASESFAGWFFGRKYDSSRDYTCCTGGQLYIHHYYETRFFGFTTGSDYSLEPIGEPGSCDTECPPENTITTGT